MQAKVYIIGSSGHAKVVIDAIEAEANYQIAGLLDDFKMVGETTLGYPVIGDLTCISSLAILTEPEPVNLFIAVGDNFNRRAIAEKINAMGQKVNYIRVLHPKASISKYTNIGYGSIVMANATLAPEVQIGSHTIINHNASVDHDSILAAFCSIAPGAVLSGNVHLGELTAIGTGSNIIEKITVGHNSVIGAGATVTHSIDENQLAIGCPAKAIKIRAMGEKYLK